MRQSVYTWTERSVVLPLFGGNSVGAVEASATAPVVALRRTAPQGWTRWRELVAASGAGKVAGVGRGSSDT